MRGRDSAENSRGSAVAVHRQGVHTLASGGYGGLAVFEGVFGVITPFLGLLFGVESRLSAHFFGALDGSRAQISPLE